MTKKIILIMLIGLFLIVPITSATIFDNFPFGRLTTNQPVNSGTVTITPVYTTTAAAYTAYCNSSYPTGIQYAFKYWQNGYWNNTVGYEWYQNGTSGQYNVVPDYVGGVTWNTASTNPTFSYQELITCSNSTTGNSLVTYLKTNVRSDRIYVTVPPEINFTGYPLDGYSPLSVTFTIPNYTAINGSASWVFGDGQTGTSSTVSINHTYLNNGVYTVSMTYHDGLGVSRTITKTNYILVSNPSGLIVNLDVNDAISGAYILDVGVGIKNTTTGVWRNGTIPFGQAYYSTTDPGYLYPISANQSITFAANKTGYRDDSTTVTIPYNNYRVYLKLVPLSVVNATGTGTVVVSVISNKNGLTLPGMSVVLDSGQMGSTNSAGTVTLRNVTLGSRYVTLSDPNGAYLPAKSSFNLSAGETKLISLQMVRVGETPVTTPVSPTQTVAPNSTYDPNNPNSPVYGNYSTTQINEQGGAGVLGMLLQLIQLWPIAVIGLFFKFMKSAMS